jgi:hypothetical protein
MVVIHSMAPTYSDQHQRPDNSTPVMIVALVVSARFGKVNDGSDNQHE